MKKAILSDYQPHANAKLLHNSRFEDVVIVASVRSGKTYALMHQVIVDAWNNPTPHPVLIVAPTRQQLTDIIFRPLYYKLLDYGLIDLKAWNKSENIIQLKNGKFIYGRSAEAYERIRGLTLWKIFIDEAALVPKECIDICKSRLLTTGGNLIIATTPRGTNNWVYKDYFDGEKKENIKYIRFNIRDNPTISDEAVEALRNQYDTLTAKQELDGEFVNLYESLVYREFNKDIHIKNLSEITRDNLWVGIDWNIGINAAIIGVKNGNKMYIIDEIYHSETVADLANRIVEKYGTDIYVVTDAMNSQSNRILLKQAGLTNIYETKSNPRRIERYNKTNAFFMNANNQTHLWIDKNCVYLIKDLENLCFKKGTDIPDDMNNEFGHASDALSYMLWTAFEGIPNESYSKSRRPKLSELIATMN